MTRAETRRYCDRKKIDMIGKKFERLLVIEQDYELTKIKKTPYYICKCDCGNIKTIEGKHLRSGVTSSCGCLRKEKVLAATKTHGMKYTVYYTTWISMKGRCNNPNHKQYKHYGERGITICEDWNKFENFYRDMKDGHFQHAFIDRIDNDKGYCKENCRWVTNTVSNQNRRCVKNIITGV